MSEALNQAKEIVAQGAQLRGFIDAYEPGESPKSHILIFDNRVIVIGHSKNRAACVAISAAVQTCAAIGRALRAVQSVELYQSTNDQPVYDIVFAMGQRSRRIIAGLVASFAGIARESRNPETGEETMLLSDRRTVIPNTDGGR